MQITLQPLLPHRECAPALRRDYRCQSANFWSSFTNCVSMYTHTHTHLSCSFIPWQLGYGVRCIILQSRVMFHAFQQTPSFSYSCFLSRSAHRETRFRPLWLFAPQPKVVRSRNPIYMYIHVYFLYSVYLARVYSSRAFAYHGANVREHRHRYNHITNHRYRVNRGKTG